ncbi:MAG: hypothetical protein WA705_16885 [Candidatus Ozemobacteraceae bacterium]
MISPASIAYRAATKLRFSARLSVITALQQQGHDTTARKYDRTARSDGRAYGKHAGSLDKSSGGRPGFALPVDFCRTICNGYVTLGHP